MLHNPTNFTDPLGLDPDDRLDRILEHVDRVIERIGRIEARALASAGTGCTLDGVPINCGVLARAIGAGITNVQPIGISGNTITATTVECTWSESTGRVCTSGVATFTLPDLGTALDNAYGKALGTVGKVFTGGRLKGQSFGACVDENIRLTTFGTVQDSTKALAVGMTGLGLTAAKSTIPGLSASEYVLLFLGATAQKFAFPNLSNAVAFGAARYGSRGIAIIGGASLGLFLGSAANCASERVGE